MKAWTFSDIPDQKGRTAVVSGANAGIGFEAARMLALKGADVVLACRDLEKAHAAKQRILAGGSPASVSVAALDLSDLDKVAAFAKAFSSEHNRLDLLINNAGVMVPPLARTEQGFELQFGTNHLGHFALAGKLLPLLSRTPNARVVVLASAAQNFGRIAFEDLNWEHRPYRAWAAYAQSKLANMMFALELHRRLAASGSAIRAVAAHPGWTATELQRTSNLRWLNSFFMKPPQGALPTLRAATDPGAAGGSYWGPAGLGEMMGPPVPAHVSDRAQDQTVSTRLWEVSEKLSGVTFPFSEARRSRVAS